MLCPTELNYYDPRSVMRREEGMATLRAIPDENITDKITRRVLSGEKGMMVW